jgi:hypothetical protein
MFAYTFAEINQSSYNVDLFNQLWKEPREHKEKKDQYQKEIEELKSTISLMNEKKKKKPVAEKIKDLHITSDIEYKRKFEMIKDNKPVIIDQQPYIPGQPIPKPKRIFKIRKGEGNKLIFQKVVEEGENKIPPKENDVKGKEDSEDENWLEKEDKEMDAILVNKEGLEKEEEKKEEKEKEKDLPKGEEEK